MADQADEDKKGMNFNHLLQKIHVVTIDRHSSNIYILLEAFIEFGIFLNTVYQRYLD